MSVDAFFVVGIAPKGGDFETYKNRFLRRGSLLLEKATFETQGRYLSVQQRTPFERRPS